MTKQFTLEQLFSLCDGRLSTNMDDVYAMLNHICDSDLMTHHLPVAMDYLRLKNPTWFDEVKTRLETIGSLSLGLESKLSDDFKAFIATVKSQYNDTYDIPQLKDEFDTSDFAQYMIDNSLLLNKK